jgi:hypothetical protein
VSREDSFADVEYEDLFMAIKAVQYRKWNLTLAESFIN